MYYRSTFFFFNDTATTEIYTLSLHDALPISKWLRASSIFTLERGIVGGARIRAFSGNLQDPPLPDDAERQVLRSEEHTSELQSRLHLVCRLLLEKKKNKITAKL